MAEVKLIVLYPYPTDVEQFNRDYQNHLKLLHKKMQIDGFYKGYPRGESSYLHMSDRC